VRAVEPETRYARSKDGHVAYRVVGSGPPDLVFIPSWTSHVDAMWEEPSLARFLRCLATFSRLLCFDKRGTGASDTVPLAALPTLYEMTQGHPPAARPATQLRDWRSHDAW
jgi:pimeloyl-ACP methyl ester carboxylesterase